MRLLFALLFCFSMSAFANSIKPINGNIPPPHLKLKDINNVEHDLQQYRGQTVLVQFWVSYCEPCITEMPSVNRLQKKLNIQGTPFKVLAVNLSETKKEVNDFLATVKTDFTILMDPEAQAQQNWNVYSAPKSYIISPEGYVTYYVNGAIEWDSEEVIKLLSQSS